MTRHHTFRPLLLYMTIAGAASAQPAPDAPSVRIETRVHQANGPALAVNLTIFSKDVIYDFAGPDESEVARFEMLTGQFVLLDGGRRVQTDVTNQFLMEFATAIGQRGEPPRPWLRPFAHPDFTETYDEKLGQLTLEQPQLVYRIQTQPGPDAAVLRAYRQFHDSYTRLNAIRPGGLPPAARLALNDALDRRGCLATRIERQLSPADPAWISEHAFAWQLSAPDHERTQRIEGWRRTFPRVSLGAYHAKEPAAPRTAAAPAPAPAKP